MGIYDNEVRPFLLGILRCCSHGWVRWEKNSKLGASILVYINWVNIIRSYGNLVIVLDFKFAFAIESILWWRRVYLHILAHIMILVIVSRKAALRPKKTIHTLYYIYDTNFRTLPTFRTCSTDEGNKWFSKYRYMQAY